MASPSPADRKRGDQRASFALLPPRSEPPGSPPQAVGGRRRRTGLYVAIAAVVVVAVVGAVAFADLGFGFDNVHVTAVVLEFVGAACPGWANASTTGVSGNAGSPVSIPIPLADQAPGGTCTAENVSVAPSSFRVVSANVPLTVDAGTGQTLALIIGLPQSSYTGPVTIFVGVGYQL